ncbi:hypothetical protein [Halopseudomonas xiamenensis]|uniref:hypothetical protein n=1 Tax=Halopseudomonas xiamenensis TaxID=157792 RepID=UPI001628CAF8|nr:hypothetical protein [Halopseudomonas xiamenensis]
MNARMGVRIGTLVAVVLLSLLALDQWRAEQEQHGQPLAWKQQYQASLWTPVRERVLTLAEVGRILGEGSLWMISADGEPRLVSRHPLDSDGQRWRVQAVIGLDQQQTDSLVEAQAWQPDMPDQAVSPAVGAALAQYPVERLSLLPEKPLRLRDIEATFGPAELRMPVEVGEAWIYAREGVVVAVSDGQAHSIMFGLRED